MGGWLVGAPRSGGTLIDEVGGGSAAQRREAKGGGLSRREAVRRWALVPGAPRSGDLQAAQRPEGGVVSHRAAVAEPRSGGNESPHW